jgi:hypothetical protein
MRALTLTQPWAGLVASGIKLVENRPRAMGADKMIGQRIAIHASRVIDGAVYERIAELAPDLAMRVPSGWAFDVTHRWHRLSRITSAIVGVATIDKVLSDNWTARDIAAHASILSFSNGELLGPDQVRWFFGPVGILLRDVRAIEPVRDVKGALGFWTLPPAIAARVEEQIK